MKPYKPMLRPKDHQALAVREMLAGKRLNFDDQGLGKTKQAYDFAAELLRAKKIDLAVFVVKASLKQTIVNEIKNDATQITPVQISGTKYERARQYAFLRHNLMVLSYENVVNDIEWLKALFDKNRTLICFDESHYIKNPKAKRTIACIQLAEKSEFKLLFSGTPIPNKKEDIYSQLLAAGYDVGSDLNQFRSKFSSDSDLRDFLESKFIRRKKEYVKELGIPEKRVRKVPVIMDETQLQIYEKFRDDLVNELEVLGMKKKCLPVSNVLTRLLRLLQIASNPHLVVDGYSGKSCKMVAIQQMVDEYCDTGKKILIWTSFRKNIPELKRMFAKHGVVELHGGISPEFKLKNSEQFRDDENVKVLIATPQCAREGFTLTSACTAIYLDRNFSYLDWAQSQDRIHRISQKERCDVVALIAEGSLDEKIDEVLSLKGDLQKFLLGDSDVAPENDQIHIADLIQLLKSKGKNGEVLL